MQVYGEARFEADLYEHRKADISGSRVLNILVVDDNRDFANILCCYFHYLGFAAKTAYDEIHAMEKIIKLQPDLVFCDIGLPRRGGYSIANKIRGNQAFESIFLVALTYFHQERIKLSALESGFDAYISRPLRSVGLKDIFEQAERKKYQYGRGELVIAG